MGSGRAWCAHALHPPHYFASSLNIHRCSLTLPALAQFFEEYRRVSRTQKYGRMPFTKEQGSVLDSSMYHFDDDGTASVPGSIAPSLSTSLAAASVSQPSGKSRTMTPSPLPELRGPSPPTLDYELPRKMMAPIPASPPNEPSSPPPEAEEAAEASSEADALSRAPLPPIRASASPAPEGDDAESSSDDDETSIFMTAARIGGRGYSSGMLIASREPQLARKNKRVSGDVVVFDRGRHRCYRRTDSTAGKAVSMMGSGCASACGARRSPVPAPGANP